MIIIKKSAEVIGDVVNLLIGEDITTPLLQEIEDNLFWYIY